MSLIHFLLFALGCLARPLETPPLPPTHPCSWACEQVLAAMFATLGLLFVFGHKLYLGGSFLPHTTHGVLGVLVREKERFQFLY